jgi:CheY-like chemotaxis protein
MSATLLLADDSVTIQRVIELTFADRGVRVIAVADGAEAIRRIAEEAPDIVLADVSMPRVDGYSVASHIKKAAALRHIPVLLLTGAFGPIDNAKVASCGCEGVLVKPFEPLALVERVEELLARRSKPSTAVEILPVVPAAPVVSVRLDEAPATFDLDELHAMPAGQMLGGEWDVRVPMGDTVDTPPSPRADLDIQPLDGVTSNIERRPRQPQSTPAFTPRQAPPEWEAALTRETAPPAAPISAPDFGQWDLPARPTYPAEAPANPVNAVKPARTETAAPPPSTPPPARSMPAAAAAPPPPVVPPPMAMAPPAPRSGARWPEVASDQMSLSSVFGALLAAEQNQPPYKPLSGTPLLTEVVIDEVVRRVIARMSGDVVQQVVVDTAERLLRQEIDKIKANNE